MSAEVQSKTRVKLYQLNAEGQWDDKGTGHVTCVQKFETFFLTVVSEDDGSMLLDAKISMDLIYQRQGDTIISWNDPDTQIDMALSFQEASGCSDIWDQICSAQGRFSSVSDDVDLVNAGPDDDFSDGVTVELPEPGLSTLDKIAEIVTDVSPYKRDKVSATILKTEYVAKLVDFFHICEDLESTEALHLLFRIFKGIVLLNDSSLFELLVSDQYLYDVVGALEYDPDVAKDTTHHRDFLRKNVVFKEVVPIGNASIVGKIHQNFRLSYLKDVILPRALDDATFATLNSLIFFNNVEIVSHLHSDEAFLNELFRQLKIEENHERTRDLVVFLQEMCNLAKNLQVQNRAAFYRALCQHGLYDIFEKVLSDTEPSIRLAGTDILSSSVSHDPSLLRSFLMSQRPRHPLFNLLVTGLIADMDTGIKAQLCEILRLLIDPETMDASPEKDTFLNLFYDEFIEKLVAPLSENEGDASVVQEEEVAERRNVARNHICDLLSFCVQHHGYRIKYFILRNNIVHKVLKLLRHREKYLVLVAIRFFRACVGIKDEFYNRYIIKNNLFQGIVDVFVANGSRYNLLNSAIIELFDFIRKENIKSLVSHVVETYKAIVEKVDYVDTFRLLILKYDQNRDLIENNSNRALASAGVARTTVYGPPRPTATADEDDAYFESDDDETEVPTSSPSGSRSLSAASSSKASGAAEGQVPTLRKPSLLPLVDYNDEEEEDEEDSEKENERPAEHAQSPSEDASGPASSSEAGPAPGIEPAEQAMQDAGETPDATGSGHGPETGTEAYSEEGFHKGGEGDGTPTPLMNGIDSAHIDAQVDRNGIASSSFPATTDAAVPQDSTCATTSAGSSSTPPTGAASDGATPPSPSAAALAPTSKRKEDVPTQSPASAPAPLVVSVEGVYSSPGLGDSLSQLGKRRRLEDDESQTQRADRLLNT